jgi:PKD repeat protein
VVDSIGENDPSPPTRTITVTGGTNQPPIANPGGPYPGTAGGAITFNGSGSSDPDGQVVSYQWSFGDGGTATGQTPTHTYANAGSYTVSLAVTDNNGAVGSASTTANVAAPNNQPPSAPTALFVQRNNKTKATLTWTDNSGNETGFKIERSADGTTFTEIATVGANVTRYQDSGAPKGYYYRVRAYNSAGTSGYSNTYQITPP